MAQLPAATLFLLAISAAIPVPIPAATPVTSAEAQALAVQQMQESLARQRESVQRQMSGAGRPFSVPWMGAPVSPAVPLASPVADCEPIATSAVEPLIAAAATAHKLKPELLRAVIRQESAFRPCAVSSKGAMGLMQIMPDTAVDFRLADPFDPAGNIQTGARYLKQLLERFSGDLKQALAAYNAGPARVEGKTIPDIPETQAYVQQILKELEKTTP